MLHPHIQATRGAESLKVSEIIRFSNPNCPTKHALFFDISQNFKTCVNIKTSYLSEKSQLNTALSDHCTIEIVSTKEGTFNCWALEVTDLRESSLLLYFCRINWAQDRLSLNYKDPCSTSPVSQRLSLSSGL